jgi:hypothetical protein
MFDLEMIVRLNCAKQARKLRRANRRFNSGPGGHAKASEKGLDSFDVHPGWITDEEWEAKMTREGKR